LHPAIAEITASGRGSAEQTNIVLWKNPAQYFKNWVLPKKNLPYLRKKLL
jgi:hypothetical protein